MVVLPYLMIRAEKLRKSFGEKTVLNEASFFIPEGQCIGIYGASGIGKSTVAKIICGVLRPDGGTVYLDEKPLFSNEMPYDRKRGLTIQMVYQQPYSALDFNQKIIRGFYEIIQYHCFAKDKQSAAALVRELTAQVGLDMEILNHLPHQISGGEAQRISIAKALLFKPRLLILDEATSMLDVSTQANVLGMIRRVMNRTGGSILLISHDAELVNYLCDKTYLFNNYQLQLKGEKER